MAAGRYLALSSCCCPDSPAKHRRHAGGHPAEAQHVPVSVLIEPSAHIQHVLCTSTVAFSGMARTQQQPFAGHAAEVALSHTCLCLTPPSTRRAGPAWTRPLPPPLRSPSTPPGESALCAVNYAFADIACGRCAMVLPAACVAESALPLAHRPTVVRSSSFLQDHAAHHPRLRAWHPLPVW